MKKTLLTTTLLLSSTITFSQTKHDYAIFHYNIHSDGKKWNDDQCKAILGDTLYYQIVNDKPHFQDTAHLSNMSYERLSSTVLDEKNHLFTGELKFTVDKKNYTSNISFVLNMSQSMIRGSEVVPGVCYSNIIGVQEHKNFWPSTSN